MKRKLTKTGTQNSGFTAARRSKATVTKVSTHGTVQYSGRANLPNQQHSFTLQSSESMASLAKSTNLGATRFSYPAKKNNNFGNDSRRGSMQMGGLYSQSKIQSSPQCSYGSPKGMNY